MKFLQFLLILTLCSQAVIANDCKSDSLDLSINIKADRVAQLYKENFDWRRIFLMYGKSKKKVLSALKEVDKQTADSSDEFIENLNNKVFYPVLGISNIKNNSNRANKIKNIGERFTPLSEIEYEALASVVIHDKSYSARQAALKVLKNPPSLERGKKIHFEKEQKRKGTFYSRAEAQPKVGYNPLQDDSLRLAKLEEFKQSKQGRLTFDETTMLADIVSKDSSRAVRDKAGEIMSEPHDNRYEEVFGRKVAKYEGPAQVIPFEPSVIKETIDFDSQKESAPIASMAEYKEAKKAQAKEKVTAKQKKLQETKEKSEREKIAMQNKKDENKNKQQVLAFPTEKTAKTSKEVTNESSVISLDDHKVKKAAEKDAKDYARKNFLYPFEGTKEEKLQYLQSVRYSRSNSFKGQSPYRKQVMAQLKQLIFSTDDQEIKLEALSTYTSYDFR